jgi:hypothetical protein
MIQWLYKHVFRGIGIAFLIGVLTLLYLKINWMIQHWPQHPPAASQQPLPGAKR